MAMKLFKRKRWSEEQIREFEKHYDTSIKRLQSGESEEAVFRDKPEGFSDWLKERYTDLGGIKVWKWNDTPRVACWNCEKEYFSYYKKCPYCNAFNKKEGRNR